MDTPAVPSPIPDNDGIRLDDLDARATAVIRERLSPVGSDTVPVAAFNSAL